MADESEFIHHAPCYDCGSSDANAVYTDGHAHCFACGAHTPSTDSPPRRPPMSNNVKLVSGAPQALKKRGISEETCAKWGYCVGMIDDTSVQIANYRLDGQVVGQKLRFPDKDFAVRGKLKCLYGQHLWNKGKMLVVTEGEIDAMSVSQAQGNKWPVVSVPNGAQGAAKAMAKQLDWLAGFETIILMFDQDEEGRLASAECAELFETGRVKIATLPLKDANDMLVAGKVKELINAIWQAKPWRPDGIVTVADIHDALLAPLPVGVPWPWETLTKLTHGRRPGEVYFLGAGTGIGKTDVFTQIIAQTITDLGEPVGVFYLEQPPQETVRRIAGKLYGKRFHVPNGGWASDEWETAVAKLEKDDRLFLYNHFGSTDWSVIKARIRYLNKAHGVRHIFLDHLTALAAHADDERRELEMLMAEIAGLAQELGLYFYGISHLATPDGKPHEEGGRVMIRHFKGSRAIGFWSHFMFGLERNQQAEDEDDQHTTVFRCLKDRFTGQSTGKVFYLSYDEETGRLHETFADGEGYGFNDETAGAAPF